MAATDETAEEREKSRERFKSWYGRNKKGVLARRKKKYHADAEYRAKQVGRVRLDYWTGRPKVVLKDIRKKVKPTFTLEETGEAGYGLQDVAKLFSRTTRTILFWINDGVIPAPIYETRERRGVRAYTQAEFALLRESAKLLGLPRKTLRESVFANSVRKDMAYLRRGYIKR